MNKKGNCQGYNIVDGKMEHWDCPFLVFPQFHSGFTKKGGPETWWNCSKVYMPIRYIKKRCELAGSPEAQRKAYINGKKMVKK